MSTERLLKRIDNDCVKSDRERTLIEFDLVDSITNHIRHLLNVRQGSVMIRNDYGLADINDITSNYREAVLVIQNSIKYCIENFEPRLGNILVQHVGNLDNPLELRFDISGDIQYEKFSNKVWLETVMSPTGQVMVNS